MSTATQSCCLKLNASIFCSIAMTTEQQEFVCVCVCLSVCGMAQKRKGLTWAPSCRGPNPNPSTRLLLLLLMMMKIMAIQANRLNPLRLLLCHMPCSYCCQVATKSSKQKPASFVCHVHQYTTTPHPPSPPPSCLPHCSQILLGQKLLKYLIPIHVRQSSI